MTRQLISPLLVVCFFSSIFSAMAQTRVDSIRERLLARDTTSVFVVAHRGDWRGFSENSLEAIESAIDMGVDIVEIDIQRTSDGQLILMHDKTIDRTTTGKGVVDELTLDSIQKTYLRNGCAIRTKQCVPTLEEALILARGRVMLNLDKADRFFSEVYALLKKTNTTDHIIMKGNKTLNQVQELYGPYLQELIYMPIVSLDDEDAEERIHEFVQKLNPVAFELVFKHHKNQLPRKIKAMLRGKSLIWYNTLWDTLSGGYDDDLALRSPDNSYGYLIRELGASIIQTDRPNYLLSYLNQRLNIQQ